MEDKQKLHSLSGPPFLILNKGPRVLFCTGPYKLYLALLLDDADVPGPQTTF